MIKQIIPAKDWFVVFFQGPPYYYFLDAVAFWALEEDEEGSRVRGYIGGDFLCHPENSPNFHLYTYGPDIEDRIREVWTEEGRKYCEERLGGEKK